MATHRGFTRDEHFLTDDPDEKYQKSSAPLGTPNLLYGVGTIVCLLLTVVALFSFWRGDLSSSSSAASAASSRFREAVVRSDPVADAAALRRLQPVRAPIFRLFFTVTATSTENVRHRSSISLSSRVACLIRTCFASLRRRLVALVLWQRAISTITTWRIAKRRRYSCPRRPCWRLTRRNCKCVFG
jgi:hypothetical protein